MVCSIEGSIHCDYTVDFTPNTNRIEGLSLATGGIFLIDVLTIRFVVLHSYCNIHCSKQNIVDTFNTLDLSAIFERLSRSVYNTTRKADDEIAPVMYFRFCLLPQCHNSVLSL